MAQQTRKTAIISGGCGGLGQVIGKKLSEDGFNVVALYYATPREKAEAAINTFAAGNHTAIPCDLRDASSVVKILTEIKVAYAQLDAYIHAAVDPILRKNILEMDDVELDEQLRVGFWGGFHFLKAAALSTTANNPGTIIGILSRVVQPDAPRARMAGYAIGKYALRGLLKELYHELASLPITVNAIAPDFMDTPLNADLPPAVRTFITERIPTKGIASTEEAARAVSFLCSDQGKAINGKIFSFNPEEIHAL
jgi:NAD(P)-dependent dehydrogenase (short-subunit alcohol dehydrogenase family)